MDAEIPPTILVEPRPDKRGFRLRYLNSSDLPVTVSIPHPRERVRLYQDGDSLYEAALPMTWKTEPPVRLNPGDELLVEIRLCPIWMDRKGPCRVECDISWNHDGLPERTVRVTGTVEVDLPSREQMQLEKRDLIQRFGLDNLPKRPTIEILKEVAELKT